MQVMRRTFVALGAVAILALVGCGGLGVNIGSGSSRSSSLVNRVDVQVQSGVNIPNVTRSHTLLMVAVAYYVFGGQQYVSGTQGATWSVVNNTNAFGGGKPCPTGTPYPCTGSGSVTGGILLFNGDCVTPYTNGVMQNICVFGAVPGTANLNATVAGSTGTVTVTVL